MSLIKHDFLPRSMFDTDLWSRPKHLGIGSSTLDLFDPFDQLDQMIAKNFKWLNKPESLKNKLPDVPRVHNKFRVTLDCTGFNPSSIKTEVSKDHSKLLITGLEGELKHGDEDFIHKHFRRTFKLPKNVEVDKLVSFMTATGKLVVEIPIKPEQAKKGGKSKNAKVVDESMPRVIEDEKGHKTVQMNMTLPLLVDPSKLKVTLKDHDLIVQGEEVTESKDETSKVCYYRRCTFPQDTNFDALKCVVEKDQLSITAPVEHEHTNGKRVIPIENVSKNNSKKLKEN